MSREYLTIGPTPCDEVCHPANGDKKMQRIEMNAFKEQLIRVMNTEFGENLCVYFSIKSFPHDFGSYSEVCVIYDDEDQTQVQQAFWIESNSPENWDAEAEKYLKDNNYVSWSNQKGTTVDNLSSICEDDDQPGEYCETCHVLGHGPNNCPSRLWINQPQGKRIEDEPKQHLLPGEVLNLVLPIGGQLQIEHTADSYSINVEETVLFNAEMYDGKWYITWPKHLSTLPVEDECLGSRADQGSFE